MSRFGRLFDRYVAVDWSARSSPATGADSIWIAEAAAGGPVRRSNPSTRRCASRLLAELIGRCGDERVVIGIDVSLGYPGGTAVSLGLRGPAWWSTWELVAGLLHDDDRNRNNRFTVAAELNRRIGSPPGPFWGCPPSGASTTLAATKPAQFALAEFRRAEHVLRSRGLRPASVWQLLGAGSVGGQTLTALPVVAGLRAGFGVEIWPFSTGLEAPVLPPGGVVVAEVWPPMFSDGRAPGWVRDAVQVGDTVGALRAADRTGALSSWFAPAIGDAADRRVVVDEEGWILGPTG